MVLVDYDPAWPDWFEALAAKVRGALGGKILALHHAGSTSVPGLAAKPVVDMVMEVADSADEPSYVPSLQAVGFELKIREPDWFEHRCLKNRDPAANLHVFTAGCTETRRMLAFRDHLIADTQDRRLYEDTKRALATRRWAVVQDYADAKTAVVAEIMGRALAHGPIPRRRPGPRRR